MKVRAGDICRYNITYDSGPNNAREREYGDGRWLMDGAKVTVLIRNGKNVLVTDGSHNFAVSTNSLEAP
jgi:hypothetical protein